MALIPYTNLNTTSDPITMAVLDTGCGSAPFDRPATRTPSVGYVAPTSVGQASFGVAGNDWSMATTPTVRPKVWEPPSYSANIDLGLAING